MAADREGPKREIRWVGTYVVAKVLGVSPRTVQRYCSSLLIPTAHHWRTLGGHGHLKIDLEYVRSVKWHFDKLRDERDMKKMRQ